MRNISSWAIKNPVFPIVLFIILTFVGIAAFIKMPITNNPDISFPVVNVNVSMPGAAPAEIETQVTQKIEAAVANIGNIKKISSWIPEGSTGISIEFQVGTPVDRAVADVRDAVSKIRSSLPQGIEEPVVQRQEIDGGSIVEYAVSTSDMTESQLSWFVDNTIAKRLQVVDGVAQVQREGGVDRQIRINLDPARLQAYGLTASEVNQQLRSLNLDASGGQGNVGGSTQAIRILGGAKTPLQLSETRIAAGNGITVRLSDIAEVKDGIAEVTSIARMNGKIVTSFGILKSKGASDVSTLASAEIVIRKILKENPNIKITELYNNVDYTKQSYDDSMQAMIEGAILAVAVVFLFLRDFRATFISALAIPLSAIPTYWFMSLMGFTLNGISLLALQLVAGILVDDAIVEIENIVRHMRMGKSAYQASLEAADEIGLAVVATSMAIAAVFLPVSFMGGIVGQFFKQFGLTVAIAVMMSLLVARTITPIVAAYFLKPFGKSEHASGPFMQKYLKILQWSIVHRWWTVGLGILFFALTVSMAIVIPKGAFPQNDDGTADVSIELTPGARLQDVAAASEQASNILRKRPEVMSVYENINIDNGRRANLHIKLVDKKLRKLSTKEFQETMSKPLQAIADARVSFNSNSGFGDHDITMQLTGENPQLLETTARALEKQMQGLHQLRQARMAGEMNRPEIIVKPRFDLAAQLGVSVQTLSETIRVATIGDIPQNLAKFSTGSRQIPIRVGLTENARTNLDTLLNLPVPTSNGSSVPLRSIADISFGEGPSVIRHYNQARRLKIEADVNKGTSLQQAQNLINALPALKNIPDGVRKVDDGGGEFLNELLSNFGIAMFTGILMVFAVLVLLYQRAFQPLTNMGSLLLAPGGALGLLLITGYEATMPVFIGILMLFGIVAKNSILLIDFAIEEMNRGSNQLKAITEAGHKRAQPIVMTTVAMIAGMLPTAFNVSGGGFSTPMAIAVIGGLALSTVLTLLIIPAGFTIVDDIEKWVGPRLGRVLTTRKAGDEHPMPVATE